MKVRGKKMSENREKTADIAGALFRKRGIDSMGVTDQMKNVVLTHGKFHGHFFRGRT